MRGDRLRQLRRARNITQEELAHIIGAGPKEIWRYENEKTQPSADTLTRLAQFLKVSTDYLVGLSEEVSHVTANDLSAIERVVIAAWRHGDKYQAIATIVNDEDGLVLP